MPWQEAAFDEPTIVQSIRAGVQGQLSFHLASMRFIFGSGRVWVQ
jgi:hypothetical protein